MRNVLTVTPIDQKKNDEKRLSDVSQERKWGSHRKENTSGNKRLKPYVYHYARKGFKCSHLQWGGEPKGESSSRGTDISGGR